MAEVDSSSPATATTTASAIPATTTATTATTTTISPPGPVSAMAPPLLSQRPDRLTFANLPTDIKTIIISYIIRPTDMVSLCLVCKELHEITVRQLYHSITLDLGSANDSKLAAFLHPRNIGLQHIRNIDLYRAVVADHYNNYNQLQLQQLQQTELAISMMLELLPPDTLDRFSWHPWSPFSTKNLLRLYKTQRKLIWLEAISIDKDICDCISKAMDIPTVIKTVHRLGLYPDSRDSLTFCNMLLSNVSKLDKLTLHTNFEDGDPSIRPEELNDSSTEPGLLTRTIFGHMQPFETCTPMHITDLVLQRVHLRYAADTFCKVIDFRKVKSLKVMVCPGAEALFAALTKPQFLPERLETLEFRHEDDDREHEALRAMDGFLCLVSGVQRLLLDISSTKSLPAAAGIVRHSRTLKFLNVHAYHGDDVSDDDEYVYDQESFVKICRECTLLEQLSVAFPQTFITRGMSDEFAAFSIALADLTNLVTLNVTTWPQNTSSSNKLSRKVYDQLLQLLAQTGFEASVAEAQDKKHSTKLNVIAFGTADKIYEREDSKTISIFVKGVQTDPLGRSSPLGIQIGWCLRKYVEPRSDILDVALSRYLSPPTREPPPSDDSDV